MTAVESTVGEGRVESGGKRDMDMVGPVGIGTVEAAVVRAAGVEAGVEAEEVEWVGMSGRYRPLEGGGGWNWLSPGLLKLHVRSIEECDELGIKLWKACDEETFRIPFRPVASEEVGGLT